tara:strand:- start:27401 stop:27616 length:216 start_codon:yes stop_codon:yes gene_type:complete
MTTNKTNFTHLPNSTFEGIRKAYDAMTFIAPERRWLWAAQKKGVQILDCRAIQQKANEIAGFKTQKPSWIK